MAERRTYQGYDYERAADGSWQRIGPSASAQPSSVIGGIPVTGGDPKLPGEVRKTNNQAAASDYDPAKAANDLERGVYNAKTQPTKDRRSLTDDIAKRYMADPAVKKYSEAAMSYARAINTKPTPQGDLSLIYAFAKIMDPESVVREGEAASVSASDTVAGRLVASLRKQIGEGGQFSPEARRELLQEMRNAMGPLNASYVQARQMYGQMAEQYGLSPQEVVGPHAGTPFSKADAKFMGTTEPERDFYGNVIKPGRPVNSSGNQPPQGQIARAGENYATDEDKSFAAQINAAFRAGASFDELNKMSVDSGRDPLSDAHRDYVTRRDRGENMPDFVPAQSGVASWLQGARGSVPGALIGGYLNGAFMGGLDEAMALPQSIIGGIPYSQALDDINAAKQALASDNPWSYGAGNLIGGITSAYGLAAAGVGSKLPLLNDIGLGAAGGALEDNDNRVGGGVIGGIVGGTLGQVGRFGASRFKRPSGVDVPITQNVERAGIDNVRGQLMEARDLGVPMSLADTDPILTTLAGSATRLSPNADRAAIETFMPRGRGQIDRFSQAIERDLGPLSNPDEQSAALLQQARDAAAPLYEQAYAAPGATTLDIADLMARPSMRRALPGAARISAEEGVDPRALGFVFDDAGNATEIATPSWKTLDYVKRGLDDVVQSNRNSGMGRLDTEGRAVNGTLTDLIARMDKMNPAYKEARAAYQGPMQLRDALEAGRNAVRQTPREVEATAARMSPAEQEQLRLGYRVGLDDRAQDVRFSSNPFETLMGTPAAEQRLSAAYGDTGSITRFLRQRDLERKLAGTTNEIIGNSKTAKRQIADEAFIGGIPTEAMLGAGVDIATGAPINSVFRALTAKGLRDRARMGALRGAGERADEMTPVLFDTDPVTALDTLDDILARTSTYRAQQRKWQPIAGTTGGVIGGILPGMFDQGR